jgi:hypothetical protein
MRQLERLSLYHRTSADNARAILESGFQDSMGYFLENRAWRGVWLSVRPTRCSGLGESDTLLRVSLDFREEELARWEWTGEKGCFRQWLIPAALINLRMTAEVVSEGEASQLAA